MDFKVKNSYLFIGISLLVICVFIFYINSGLLHDFADLLIENWQVILEKIISGVFQFILIIPLLKWEISKMTNRFFNEQQISIGKQRDIQAEQVTIKITTKEMLLQTARQEEKIINIKSENELLREKVSTFKKYLVNVDREVKKFYFYEHAIQKNLLGIWESIDKNTALLHKISAENTLLRKLITDDYGLTSKHKANKINLESDK